MMREGYRIDRIMLGRLQVRLAAIAVRIPINGFPAPMMSRLNGEESVTGI
jgi:hypothetical protein